MTKKLLSAAAAAMAIAALAAWPAGADNDSGFHTAVPAMLTPLAPDASGRADHLGRRQGP